MLPAGQTIDVRFDEFMADDVAMVERIYALAGQPFTAEARAAMEAFMADHPRGKFGGVVYDLADFGLDRDGAAARAALLRRALRRHRGSLTREQLAGRLGDDDVLEVRALDDVVGRAVECVLDCDPGAVASAIRASSSSSLRRASSCHAFG